MSHDTPRRRTRVARALLGDNHFRGHSVADELVGRDTTSLYALALGLGLPDERTRRVLDAIVAASLAADPRIWPVKVAPLVASYGSALAGVGAATSYFEGMMVSPTQSSLAAEYLSEVAARERGGEPLEAILAERTRHIPGFGVPRRPVDERVLALSTWYEANVPADERPHWELMRRIESARGVRPNITGATGAACLDVGIEPPLAGLVSFLGALLCVLPNALEATHTRIDTMRAIPKDCLCYTGRSPRNSPRKK